MAGRSAPSATAARRVAVRVGLAAVRRPNPLESLSDWTRARRGKAAATKGKPKSKARPKAKPKAGRKTKVSAASGAAVKPAAKPRAPTPKAPKPPKPPKGPKRPREPLPRPDWRVVGAGAGLAGAAVLAWAVIAGPLAPDDGPEVETKVVTVAVETDDAADAPVGPLGFPLVATRNTTRVGGPDPASDAAAVALATHPRSPLAAPIEAAALVEDSSPYAGIAAASLAAQPLGAPLLIGGDELPEPTADALAKLNPKGGGPGEAAVYRIGEVPAPDGYTTEKVGGGSPAETANAVDELRTELIGDPGHIVVASGDEPGYAMPAAGWAARSGDPVLFTGKDEVPQATLDALERHEGVPVYVLGPPSVISENAVRQIERITSGVQRVGAEGRVANAIAFARYTDVDFGWNINDPGHGLVMANTARPLDATAAATLSASGKWGPLLVIETPATLPTELRDFLLDIKPGYETDPTRAVYNHVWLIGDSSAIGGRVQAEVDELAELAPISAAAAPPGGIGQPSGPEPEPDVQDDAGGSGDNGADQP